MGTATDFSLRCYTCGRDTLRKRSSVTKHLVPKDTALKKESPPAYARVILNVGS